MKTIHVLTQFCVFLAVIMAVAWNPCSFVVDALTDAQTQNITNSLQFYEAFLSASIENAVIQLSSTSSSCSYNNIACNPYIAVPKMNFSQGIPQEYAYVQPKEAPGQSYATKLSQVCQLVRMGPQWLQNYNASKNKIAFQYFTYPDAFAGFYPQSAWNCSEVYIPTERPYYVSGATGARDVVILVDASSKASDSAWRLATAKKIATKIVRSLSFKDYVAIVAYGDQPDQQIAYLTQASSSNIDNILRAINSVTLFPNNGTNIGAALTYAFSVFSISKSIGVTSSCTQMVVLLSGGDNSFSVPKPGVPISNNLNAITFPFLITTNMSDDKAQLMRGIACASNTVTRNFTGDNTANISQIGAITEYFSKLISTPVMRWSEVYSEDDGAGRLVTLSAPVFVDNLLGDAVLAGVVSLDAPVQYINNGSTISDDEINIFILSTQVCTPLNQRDAAQATNVLELQKGTCGSSTATSDVDAIGFRTTATGEQLAINKGMPGIITGSVLFIVILFGVLFYLNYRIDKSPSSSYGYECSLVATLLVAFLICWIISIPIMFSLVAPDLVRVNNYVETELTLTSTKPTPFRCCEVTSCNGCQSTSASRCSSLIPQYVANPAVGNGPFICSGGYYCCSTYCYSCNCHTSCSGSGKSRSCSTHCSTCCRCTSSVSQRSCNLYCGTCYQMTTLFLYRYQGILYQSSWGTTCTLVGSATCRDNWIANYIVPSKRNGYVNPENPIEVLEHVEIRKPPFIAFMVFACLSIPLLLGALCFMVKETCCKASSAQPANWDLAKPLVTPQASPKQHEVVFSFDSNANGQSGSTEMKPRPISPIRSNVGAGDNALPPPGGYNFGGGPQPYHGDFGHDDNDNSNNNVSHVSPRQNPFSTFGNGPSNNNSNNNPYSYNMQPPPENYSMGVEGI